MSGALDRLGRGIDKLIGVFSPETQARRTAFRALTDSRSKFARNASGSTSAYEAARTSRRNRNLGTSPGSPDTDLDPTSLASLREFSRERDRNDALASAIVRSLADNVIGCGIRPNLVLRPDRLGITKEKAKELRDIHSDLWDEWLENAESTGRATGPGLQHQVLAQTVINGDHLLKPVMLPPFGRRRFEFSLESIEADRLDSPGGYENPLMRSGVELHPKRGHPTAYWIADEHPGDRFSRGNRNFSRIPAFSSLGRPNILHVYWQERAGQSRGRPMFSNVLRYFRDLDDFVEATLVAAQVASCIAMFIKRKDPWGSMLGRTTQETQGQAKREEELSPGMIGYLAEGEEPVGFTPGQPGPQFGDFFDRMTRHICSGLGIPYAVATRNYSKMTYSQARAEILEARRMFQLRQRWMVDSWLRDANTMMLEEAYLKGWFPAGRDFLERQREWTRTVWIMPGWGWLDPKGEIDAVQTSISLGLKSRAAAISEASGEDYTTVFESLAAEAELATKLGIEIQPNRASPPSSSSSSSPAEDADAGAEPDPTDPAEDTPADTDPAEPATATKA